MNRPRSLENPATGERLEFHDSTDGSLRFDYVLAPGGFAMGRIDHLHPHQQERFEVQSGRLGVRIDGDEWTATPGTRFAIPPGTPHTVWNDGTDEVHATIEIWPALEIRTLFETMHGLARDGHTNGWGLPGPLQLAVIADAFGNELRFAGVPATLQRTVAAGLAPIGRLAGRRARYPRYSDHRETTGLLGRWW